MYIYIYIPSVVILHLGALTFNTFPKENQKHIKSRDSTQKRCRDGHCHLSCPWPSRPLAPHLRPLGQQTCVLPRLPIHNHPQEHSPHQSPAGPGQMCFLTYIWSKELYTPRPRLKQVQSSKQSSQAAETAEWRDSLLQDRSEH